MTKYVVSGPVAFDDHAPGEEFEADLDPDLEARALERGSIEIVSGQRKKKEESTDA